MEEVEEEGKEGNQYEEEGTGRSKTWKKMWSLERRKMMESERRR